MIRGTLVLTAILAMGACADTPTNPTQLTPLGSQASSSTGPDATTESRIDPSFGHGGAELSASLTGAAELPGPGDPDGSGSARITLNAGQGEVCFRLEVSNIAPATAAHIHVGDVTTFGPVVVGLAPPTSGSSTACVSADQDLVQEIHRNPAAYYVNVHNADFPAGAIRGQLAR